MITGDNVVTASAIAAKIGITGKTISGRELDEMSEEELTSNIDSYGVYARVAPEHKLRIVKCLQRKGEIVAMTGDGVNDAPALKAADIGCSMGKGGTEVARCASDMVLTDDNFASIVAAVREGRCIYDNIRRAVHFLISSNIGEMLTILVAVLFVLPEPLAAVQLLWVNLITDSLPAIALGVEKAEPGIMLRKPQKQNAPIFGARRIREMIFEGIVIGTLVLIAFGIGGQTMAFAVAGVSQLFHAYNMRSSSPLIKGHIFENRKLNASFIICFALQLFIMIFPPARVLFKVEVLSASQWFYTIALSFMPIPVVECYKIIGQKKEKAVE